MNTPWDALMKMLIGANPQHFISLLLGGATFRQELSNELQVRSRSADFRAEVDWNGQPAIVHIEFQRRRDARMGRRLWEYNVTTDLLAGLPVCSFVIYLRKDGTPVTTPYERFLPDGERVHTFSFRSICLWELPARVLKQVGLEGMLPLMPLTRDGEEAPHKTVDEMIGCMKAAGKTDLYALGYAFAALVFTSPEEHHWLNERFEMLGEVLEESWGYQEIFSKGEAKGEERGFHRGLHQGLDQGVELGKVAQARATLLRCVRLRFPGLIAFAEEVAERIKGKEVFETLLDQLISAETTEQARIALSDAAISAEKTSTDEATE